MVGKGNGRNGSQKSQTEYMCCTSSILETFSGRNKLMGGISAYKSTEKRLTHDWIGHILGALAQHTTNSRWYSLAAASTHHW